MRILVIGGTGFIGSAFAGVALAKGHAVRVLSRHSPDRQNKSHSIGAIEYVSGDISDVEVLDRATADVDICLHAASTTVPFSANNFMELDVNDNLIGSLRAFQSCVRSNVKRVILVSSGGTVYGRPRNLPIVEAHPTDPISAYGIVKLAIEKYLALFGETYGLDYRIARLSNPYGPKQNTASGQGVVAAFVEQILNGKTLLLMGDGTVVRDFVYIDDVADALLRLCSHPGPSRIFNVGSGAGTSIGKIVASIADLTQLEPNVEYRESRKFDVLKNVLSCELARRELQWSATTTLDAGLRAAIDAKKHELERIKAHAPSRPGNH